MKNQRQDPRIPLAADITALIKTSPDQPELQGIIIPIKTRDISLRGVQLKTDRPVPAGTLLEIVIELGQTGKHLQTGCVMWDENLSAGQKEPFHVIGVKFFTLDEPQFSLWSDALSRFQQDIESD